MTHGIRLTEIFSWLTLAATPGSSCLPQITGEQLKALEQLQKEGKLPEDPWVQRHPSMGDVFFLPRNPWENPR